MKKNLKGNLGDYWDEIWSRESEPKHNPFVKEVGKYFIPSSKKDKLKLLEIGCGDGRDTNYFVKQGYEITALDIAPISMKKLQKKFKNVKAYCEDIRNIKLEKDEYDIVYAHLTLHYFNDLETTEVFNKIYNSLKSGGYFFVKCKSVKDRSFGKGTKIAENCYIADKGHFRHFFTKEYMKKQLSLFQIEELKETHATYNNYTSNFIEAIAIKQ